jgi:hypothetical protein
MHVVVPIVILGLSLVSLFSMAMFNVFLLNLLPQSCGQWFLLCQISSFCERRIFHCKFPFLKEKMLEKELIFLSNLLTIWKGAQDFLLSYFEYYQFWLNVCLDDQLSLNPSASSQFFKKSLVEGCEEYDLLGWWYLNHPERTASRCRAYCTHLQPHRYGALTENRWFDFGDVRS